MSATKPFFISTKEISLFDSMNEELIDEFVGQSVDIYKINTQHTKDNITSALLALFIHNEEFRNNHFSIFINILGEVNYVFYGWKKHTYRGIF